MSNIWIYSDPHFYHKNSLTLINRPFSSVEEMNEHYIENINKNAKRGDQVYCLGDFSFGNLDNTEEILKRFNVKQTLIFGNHDKAIRKHQTRFANYFNGMHDLFDFRINNQVFVLCHYPMRSWEKSGYGSILMHGHCHGALPPHGKSVDVGVDASFVKGKPAHGLIHIDEIIEFMKTQSIFKEYE